jgi:hypothetical protein
MCVVVEDRTDISTEIWTAIQYSFVARRCSLKRVMGVFADDEFHTRWRLQRALKVQGVLVDRVTMGDA